MQLRSQVVPLVSALLILSPGCLTPELFEQTGCHPEERLSGSMVMILCNQTDETFHIVIEYGYENAYWERDQGTYDEAVHGEIVAVEQLLEPGVRLIVPRTWDDGEYRGRIMGTHATTDEQVTMTIKFETDSCRGSSTGTDIYILYDKDAEDNAYGLRHSGACV